MYPSTNPSTHPHASGLQDPSALFRHEVAYCLGQRQDPAAITALVHILRNKNEHPMYVACMFIAIYICHWYTSSSSNLSIYLCRVRHEAGEALGAIGTPPCLEPLKQYVDDECLELAQTCQLALQRIEYHNAHDASTVAGSGGNRNNQEEEQQQDGPSPYLSVDPTPPAPATTSTPELRACLLDDQARIFNRYRAMFALRNRGGSEAVAALAESFASNSALLKHEVAYVLGQMQDSNTVDQLREVLEDGRENPMVRHEAAEALGSIAAPECIALLQHYARDREPIVADSCVVALDMLQHEQSGGFEYADVTGC